jgi:hypothetical protein
MNLFAGGISTCVRLFKRAYGKNKCHVYYKLFLGYFHKLFGITYENNL